MVLMDGKIIKKYHLYIARYLQVNIFETFDRTERGIHSQIALQVHESNEYTSYQELQAPYLNKSYLE